MGIEDRVHWVRDVTFDEDRHQLRTSNAPQVMVDCWVFFGQCLFVFQAAFFRPKNSLSASFGVRYPRAE